MLFRSSKGGREPQRYENCNGKRSRGTGEMPGEKDGQEKTRLFATRTSARFSASQKKGCNTRTSQGMTHPGIALAQARLGSEFRWDPVHRCWYDRTRRVSLAPRIYGEARGAANRSTTRTAAGSVRAELGRCQGKKTDRRRSVCAPRGRRHISRRAKKRGATRRIPRGSPILVLLSPKHA